jgi:chemotaxis response regulator CheB
MPKEVIKAGAVDRVVPFDRISQKIIRRLHHS